MIVGVGVTEAANDQHELMPALKTAQENTGVAPKQVIADNGYATRENVESTSKQGVELIAPWKEGASREAGACAVNGIAVEFAPSAFRATRGAKELICPAGKTLVIIGQKKQHGEQRTVYEAQANDCAGCGMRTQCLGKRAGPRQVTRVIESAAMKEYLKRMKDPEMKALYKKRSRIAEFPHLWAKAVKKLVRFNVRGAAKAEIEATWVALAYNFSQLMRLRANATATATA
jgi:hypothetical protein